MSNSVGDIRLIIHGRKTVGAGRLLELFEPPLTGPHCFGPDDWEVEILHTGEKLLFAEYDIGRRLTPLEVLAWAASGSDGS